MLYVADDPINAILLREMSAARPEVEVEIVVSGAAALLAVRARPPHLLLLDMNLGDMTGLELRESLLQNPDTAALPCIALRAVDGAPER